MCEICQHRTHITSSGWQTSSNWIANTCIQPIHLQSKQWWLSAHVTIKYFLPLYVAVSGDIMQGVSTHPLLPAKYSTGLNVCECLKQLFQKHISENFHSHEKKYEISLFSTPFFVCQRHRRTIRTLTGLSCVLRWLNEGVFSAVTSRLPSVSLSFLSVSSLCLQLSNRCVSH